MKKTIKSRLPNKNNWPTIGKLVAALIAEDDPQLKQTIINARKGHYHDYLSPHVGPLVQLVADLRHIERHDCLIDRVIDGEFDATKEEADRWALSEDGQDAFRMLLGEEWDG